MVVPDAVIDTTGVGLRAALPEILSQLSDGVTEIVAHPATDADELWAFAADAELRIDDLKVLTREASLPSALRSAGATVIGWRPLIELAGRASGSLI